MRRRVKNWVVFHLARAAIRALGILPAGVARRVGAALGRLAHALAAGERRIARRQLAAALSSDEGSRRVRTLTRGVFVHLGVNAAELCRLMRRPGDRRRIVLEDGSRRALDAALAGGRGAVFVTGHVGSWELMAAELARLGYPISTVAKESYDPRFTRFLEEARSRLGVEVILRGRPGAAAAMLRALRCGRVLGILVDQDTEVPSVFVPFFGRPARTPVGAALLARRTGAPVVVGTIRRSAAGHHAIRVEPFLPEVDDERTTAAMTSALEQRIRRHPSQWVWFHRRWRSPPPVGAAT